jgi:hypothetical protein
LGLPAGQALGAVFFAALRLRFFGASITPVQLGAPQRQANAFLIAAVCRPSYTSA